MASPEKMSQYGLLTEIRFIERIKFLIQKTIFKRINRATRL